LGMALVIQGDVEGKDKKEGGVDVKRPNISSKRKRELNQPKKRVAAGLIEMSQS